MRTGTENGVEWVLRRGFANLCGYVRLEPGHPWLVDHGAILGVEVTYGPDDDFWIGFHTGGPPERWTLEAYAEAIGGEENLTEEEAYMLRIRDDIEARHPLAMYHDHERLMSADIAERMVRELAASAGVENGTETP